MRDLYKSTANQVVLLKLFLSSDHVTPATGKTVAVVISKNGGTFGNPNAGATNATEISNGWYKATLDATDTNTEGDLVVRGTATACDDAERLCIVIAGDAYSRIGAPAGASLADDVAAVKGVLPAALVSGRIDASVGAMAANVVTATAVAADAVTELQAGLSTLDAAGVRAAVGLATANTDVQLAAIAGYIDTEVAATLAAVDTEVAAIKAKTDNLPASPAAVSNIPTVAAIAAGVLDEAMAGHVAAGSLGALLNSALDAAISSRLATAGYTAPLDAGGVRSAVGIAAANLDAQLSALAGYIDTEVAAILAAVDTEVAAIKAKTDALPAAPAAVSDIPTAAAVAAAAADAMWAEVF